MILCFFRLWTIRLPKRAQPKHVQSSPVLWVPCELRLVLGAPHFLHDAHFSSSEDTDNSLLGASSIIGTNRGITYTSDSSIKMYCMHLLSTDNRVANTSTRTDVTAYWFLQHEPSVPPRPFPPPPSVPYVMLYDIVCSYSFIVLYHTYDNTFSWIVSTYQHRFFYCIVLYYYTPVGIR